MPFLFVPQKVLPAYHQQRKKQAKILRRIQSPCIKAVKLDIKSFRVYALMKRNYGTRTRLSVKNEPVDSGGVTNAENKKHMNIKRCKDESNNYNLIGPH